MKKLRAIFCLITLALSLMPAGLWAQTSEKRKISGNKTEEKAEKCNYTIADQREMNMVYNKNNKLMLTESRFQDLKGYSGYAPVKFKDRPKLDSLVQKIIAPFYKHFLSKYPDDVSSFTVYLYSGLDGKVCEMTFSYQKDAKIPLKAIEKLEQQALETCLKLDFDRNNSFFKGSNWVEVPCTYTVAGMKKKLKENEKN